MSRTLTSHWLLSTALLLAALLTSSAVFAQKGAQIATPSTPVSTSPTLKAGTQLVVLDVVVTDNNHKPVQGLRPSDFTLAEDNVTQAVSHFEEHTSLTPAEAAALPPPPVLLVGILTNESPAPSEGAVNLLLLDSLNTPMVDQVRVYQQLLKFLQQATPSTRIAIFGLTSHLVILRGFTTDFSLLKTVVARSLAHGSHLLDDQTGGSGTSNSDADNLEDTTNNLNINNPNVTVMIANMRQLEAQQSPTNSSSALSSPLTL